MKKGKEAVCGAGESIPQFPRARCRAELKIGALKPRGRLLVPAERRSSTEMREGAALPSAGRRLAGAEPGTPPPQPRMLPRSRLCPPGGRSPFPGASGRARCSPLIPFLEHAPRKAGRSHNHSGDSGTFPPVKPGEENPVGIPEPQAPAGCSGNAQNAAVTYSGLVGTALKEGAACQWSKGLSRA